MQKYAAHLFTMHCWKIYQQGSGWFLTFLSISENFEMRSNNEKQYEKALKSIFVANEHPYFTQGLMSYADFPILEQLFYSDYHVPFKHENKVCPMSNFCINICQLVSQSSKHFHLFMHLLWRIGILSCIQFTSLVNFA